jgi:ATP-dependent Clp endopeptidase proteolytic subunit ClpP
MKLRELSLCIFAAASILQEQDLERSMPEAKGRSVLALNAGANGEAELLIYGPVGDFFWDGVTARDIVEQLAGLTAATINVRINSDGGSVTDGLAIYNALKRHAATIRVSIDGIAASIASLIAMAGDSVAMYANTMLMVHAPMSGAFGNAVYMRQQADVLDTWSKAMRESYVAKTGKGKEVDAMLTDGVDHYFTAPEALAFGFVDEIVDNEPALAGGDKAAAAALLSYINAITNSQGSAIAALRHRIQAACSPSAFASLREGHQRAVFAHLKDSPMKDQCQLILANGGGAVPTPVPPPPAATAPATPPASAPPTAATAVPVAPAAVTQTPTAPTGDDAVLARVAARNESIRGVFAQFRDIGGVAELETSCLADPRMTVEQAQARLLARMGNGATPLSDPATPRVEPGRDASDGLREQIVLALLARAGVLAGAEADRARQGNPFIRTRLIALAEQSLLRGGITAARTMDREQIAQRVLAQQGTSDFPILLENVLHKIVVGAYALAPFTWQRFCSTGTLTDYRPHPRYHLSSFSDLKETNEHGEYEDGTLGDGAKETVQGKRKGRILRITPEVLINDDLGAFVRIAQALGQAAGRTIEKDVFALFALNSGAGPTMSDGKALFHTDHGNIDTSSAAPTVASMDAGSQLMGQQKDVGGHDYLDLRPAIWLGPKSKVGAARTVVNSEYDPDTANKLQRYNISRNIVRDVVDSPRLSGTAWYLLADPQIEPVFEVSFLDGVQTPTLVQETEFRTSGLAWKVEHRYAVGAVGYRGATKNAGA